MPRLSQSKVPLTLHVSQETYRLLQTIAARWGVTTQSVARELIESEANRVRRAIQTPVTPEELGIDPEDLPPPVEFSPAAVALIAKHRRTGAQCARYGAPDSRH